MKTNANKPLVDIPTGNGEYAKKSGKKGERYVYRPVSFFRNAEGKPRNRAKTIGKFDPATGKMFPNDNYYALYGVSRALTDVFAEYGYIYLFRKCCRDTGLFECLHEVFGKATDEMISVAAYMVREGNAMDGIDDWQERTLLPGIAKKLDSRSCSKLFDAISPQMIHNFFKKWVKKTMTTGSVCYDVTSVSSYSETMSDIERGYNRDGEDLAQFNLGMFCDESAKVPMYYNRYNGSLTDKTNLPYVLANAKSVGIQNVKLILDGGFMSKDCFVGLKDACCAFTMGVPAHLEISKTMINERSAGINAMENKLPNQEIFCVEKALEHHGASGRLLLYFDPMTSVVQCSGLSETVQRLAKNLAKLKRYPNPEDLKKYEKYFVITKHTPDSGFDWSVDCEKVNELRRHKGFFLLFSTDMSSKPEDLLYYYRAKDADEKLFEQIKVDMDGGRVRTHNESTTEGKIFVTFIALAIRAYIFGKLDKYLADSSTSLKKTLNKLANIIVVSTDGKYRFAKALTKTQKDILECFTAVKDITASLDRVCMR